MRAFGWLVKILRFHDIPRDVGFHHPEQLPRRPQHLTQRNFLHPSVKIEDRSYLAIHRLQLHRVAFRRLTPRAQCHIFRLRPAVSVRLTLSNAELSFRIPFTDNFVVL
jgi:hypothetical protein